MSLQANSNVDPTVKNTIFTYEGLFRFPLVSSTFFQCSPLPYFCNIQGVQQSREQFTQRSWVEKSISRHTRKVMEFPTISYYMMVDKGKDKCNSGADYRVIVWIVIISHYTDIYRVILGPEWESDPREFDQRLR